jgi:tetratricopeptide (TPR) repeat protein
MTILRARLGACLLVLLPRTFRPLLSSPHPRVYFQQGSSPQTPDQQQAEQILEEGVRIFKNGQYVESAQLFMRAKALDPNLLNARLYLATAYAHQYIPGAPSEENNRMGELATEEYKGVLQIDSQNLSAIDGLASLLYQRAGQPFDAKLFNESRSYYQMHIRLEPKDPVPHYCVGVIDWSLAYRGNTLLREEFNKAAWGESGSGKGLNDVDPLPEAVRLEYVRQFGMMVDEGIDSLKQTITLKPDYDDAMDYLNLLYRRKADMAATKSARRNYTRQANKLLFRVREIKMKKAEMAGPGKE